MADRTIRVTVVGDSRSLQSALKTSEKSLASLDARAAKSQQSLTKMESGFSSFGKGAALLAGASAISAAFLQVTQSASKLQTAQAANQRIWGEQAAGMQQAAEAAADYGLAQADYLQTAAKLGSQLRNLGMDQDNAAVSAQSLMRMGENLAATFGTDVPQAVTAISAALRGEFDPLEQYGIGITAAAVSSRMAAEGISKAQAVINIAMEQSTATIGAAAAAQDTYAGKQRALAANFENAKAAIGEGFLPAASAAVDVMSGLAKGVQAIPEGLRSLAGTAIAAGVAIKGLQLVMGMGAVKTAAFAAAMERSSGAFTSTVGAYGMGRLSTAIGKVGNALPVVGVAVIALGEAFAFLDAKAKEAAVSQEDLTKAITGTGDAAAIGTVADQIKEFAPAMAQLQSDSTNVFGAVKQLGGLFLNWGTNSGIASTQESIDNLNRSLEELMAVNPAAGAAAVQAAYDQMVAAGVPADVAVQHLRGSLVQADQITQLYGQSTVDAAAKVQSLTSAFDAASQRATEFGHALDALFVGLDVDVAAQRFAESLRGIKAAAEGGFRADEIQALSQSWRAVSEAMMTARAPSQEIIDNYDAMRSAAKMALGDIGIKSREAGRILDDVFGKRREFIATVRADPDPALDAADNAQKALDRVKQSKRAQIQAVWFGGGETKRADRDIDGVRQDRPASIDADASGAVSAASQARFALDAATGTYTAVLQVYASVTGQAQAIIDRLWGGGSWWDDQYGEIEEWMGPQLRAKDSIRDLLGAKLGGKKKLNLDVNLRLNTEGDWEATIAQLTKLQELAQQTNKKGKPTALALAARAELRSRRQLLESVQDYIRSAKVMFGGDKVGYTILKRKLDAARSAMTQLAAELAEAANGVDLGAAWSAVTSGHEESSQQLEQLRDQLDDLRKARAETWNPRLIDHYNREILKTSVAMKRVTEAEKTNTLKAQLNKQLATTRQFYTRINALRGKVSAEALAELIRQGPEEGSKIAAELLNDKKLRDTYDDAYKTAAAWSRKLGGAVAEDVYRPQLTAITNAIAALRSQVEAWLKKRKQVQVELNWTKWKLPKKSELPAWVTQAADGHLKVDQKVNVTVQGMVADPEGTARAIKRLLRDSGNRNGNVSWAA